ncbi:Pentatricopeptide repeat-containing protein [Apostasia shenzhenica]|uniref:Pentatricopeptide repeat-containing protein n=1 Tax=Apostasia shenzhenica TaxID=1088818 RepID=A0A2I0BBM1_9ASPA|nr:Pentatricopeptide repeat-containing protein [Apostasia shenzhenica]
MLTKKIKLLLHHNLSVTLNSFLSFSELRAAHAHLIISGRTADNFVASRLLAAAATPISGNLSYARSLFASLATRTVFSYNTIIRATSNSTDPLQSLYFYLAMLRSGLSPDKFTFPFVLRSCASLQLAGAGAGVHCQAAKLGLEGDLYVVNNAITMYSSMGDMAAAQRIFDEHRDAADVVSWTALITGFSNRGEMDTARSLFDRAPLRNLVTWNAMLAGYARAGRAQEAQKLFDKMTERNAASWSSLISGFVQAGRIRMALDVFRHVAELGIWPNEPLLVSAVSACAKLRALEKGRWVHRYIERIGVKPDVILGTALVDMYGKCGGIKEAIEVFNSMPEKNIYSWSSAITGLAMNGAGTQALTLFCKMNLAGLLPNAITFTDLLSACSHNGLIEEGGKLFDEMSRIHGIRPEKEHYGCMVDLLGRAGLIREAVEFIEQMPVDPHPSVWGALAAACRNHEDIELGEDVGKRLIELEPGHGGRYVLLSNIYGAASRWDDMAIIRRLLKERGAAKSTGSSLVEAQ